MTPKEIVSIPVPALKRLTLEEVQAIYSWVKEVKDTSSEEAMVLNFGTVLEEGESSISGAEYEKRLELHAKSLAGLQHLMWLEEHRDEFPQLHEAMKKFWLADFAGTFLRDSRGDWSVPCAYWRGARWDRSAFWLSRPWPSGCRVVLLGIDALDPLHPAPLNLDPLPIAEPALTPLVLEIGGERYEIQAKKI